MYATTRPAYDRMKLPEGDELQHGWCCGYTTVTKLFNDTWQNRSQAHARASIDPRIDLSLGDICLFFYRQGLKRASIQESM